MNEIKKYMSMKDFYTVFINRIYDDIDKAKAGHLTDNKESRQKLIDEVSAAWDD